MKKTRRNMVVIILFLCVAWVTPSILNNVQVITELDKYYISQEFSFSTNAVDNPSAIWTDSSKDLYVCCVQGNGSLLISYATNGSIRGVIAKNDSSFLDLRCTDDDYIYTSGITVDNHLTVNKWDKSLENVWNRTWFYGSPIFDCQIHITTEGFLITSGRSYAGAILVCWSTSGSQFWNLTIGSDDTYRIERVQSLHEDFLPFVYFCLVHHYDAYLMKYDILGNLIWNKTSPRTGDEVSLKVGDDDEIYLGVNQWLMRWNSSGGMYWEREIMTRIGYIFIHGDRIILTNSWGGYWMIACLDSVGNKIWCRVWTTTCASVISCDELSSYYSCIFSTLAPKISGSDGLDYVYTGSLEMNDLLIIQWNVSETPRINQASLIPIQVMILLYLLVALFSIALFVSMRTTKK